MLKYAIILGSLCLAVLDGSAQASSCGKKAVVMLRRYNSTQSAQTSPRTTGGGSSAASTQPIAPGAVTSLPVTSVQQQKLSELSKKALVADQAGDVAGCKSDMAEAMAIIKH